MRAVVQRVDSARVEVNQAELSRIGRGLLVYLGVDQGDTPDDAAYLIDKVRQLRIFPDDAGKMNLDVEQSRGEVLVVSAFTVSADARKGRRPSFDSAAPPDQAQSLYELFCGQLAGKGLPVARGSFGDYMLVSSVNAGPICILLSSRRLF